MSIARNDAAPEGLLDRATSGFERHFGGRPTHAAAAPGRVNLIGEHTDYNDGFVLPMAIEQRTVLVGRTNGTQRARVIATDLDDAAIDFACDTTLQRGDETWANYVMGVAGQFIEHGHSVLGFDAVIASDIPVGGGLSSSAALEVAGAMLMQQLIGVAIEPKTMALWCQAAEHEYVGMPCGIMDQFISVFGRRDHALLIDCRSQQTRHVALNDPEVAVVVANSNVKHELSDSAYAERRSQCEQAAAILDRRFGNIGALRDATLDQLEAARSDMDDVLYRRARHVIGENDRTLAAADALDAGAYETFGQLMGQSHRSLAEDYQVSCDELDLLVELAMAVDGVYGSRMTGGGFGGCTVTLVRRGAADRLMRHLVDQYRSRAGRRATCFATRPADGADEIKLE